MTSPVAQLLDLSHLGLGHAVVEQRPSLEPYEGGWRFADGEIDVVAAGSSVLGDNVPRLAVIGPRVAGTVLELDIRVLADTDAGRDCDVERCVAVEAWLGAEHEAPRAGGLGGVGATASKGERDQDGGGLCHGGDSTSPPHHRGDEVVPDKGSHGVVSVGQLVIAWIASDDGSLTIVPSCPSDRNQLVLPSEFDDVDLKVDGIIDALKLERRGTKPAPRNATTTATARKVSR